MLLLEDPAQPRPRLLAALRIQLSDSAEVRTQAWGSASVALPERMREANRLAASDAFAAVVWVETASDAGPAHEAVLYVVGKRIGRALLELVRVPVEESPDLERVLALKLGELLAELRTPQPAAALLEVTPPPPAAEPPALPPPSPAWIAQAELALGPRLVSVLTAPLTHFGFGARITPRMCLDAWCLGLGLGLDSFPTVHRSWHGAPISLHELVPGARLELRFRTGALAFSAHAGAALAFTSVRGKTALGTAGESDVRTASGSFGLGAAHALSRALAVGGFAQITLLGTRQRFTINGGDALDLGRAQLLVGLELLLRAPLSAAP